MAVEKKEEEVTPTDTVPEVVDDTPEGARKARDAAIAKAAAENK